MEGEQVSWLGEGREGEGRMDGWRKCGVEREADRVWDDGINTSIVAYTVCL